MVALAILTHFKRIIVACLLVVSNCEVTKITVHAYRGVAL